MNSLFFLAIHVMRTCLRIRPLFFCTSSRQTGLHNFMFRTSGLLPTYGRFVRFRTARFTNKDFFFRRRVLQTCTSTCCRPRNIASRRTLHTSTQKPMDFQAGPLVWIDCEMTGLDPRKDKILEIAVSRLYIRAVEHFLPNVDRTLFGVGVDHGRRP